MNYTFSSSWIDASVTLPLLPCLACDENKNLFIPKGILAVKDEEHGHWCMDADTAKGSVVIDGDEYSAMCYENRITHWMPLPSPPPGYEKGANHAE